MSSSIHLFQKVPPIIYIGTSSFHPSPPFVTPGFWFTWHPSIPDLSPILATRPHLLSFLSFLQWHVGHLQGNRCTCWQVDHHLGTRNFDLIRNPQRSVCRSGICWKTGVMPPWKKKTAYILNRNPSCLSYHKKKTKKKLDLSSTKKIPQELSIKCVETTDRASERTPQSPSHVPLSPKNGPKVTGSVHVFFFGGGGGWGRLNTRKRGWIPCIFEAIFVNVCVCVCLCKIRVSKSSRSSAIYPSNLSFFVELTKLVFGRPRKRFWVSRTSTKRWTFVEISSFPGCQVNGTDRPSTFGVDIWW